jgi:sulfhydrogenase subunit alpha
VSPRVGGFSRVPRPAELAPLRSRYQRAAEEILEVADWAARFESPSLPRPAELLALVHPDHYPMNEGTVATSTGAAFDAARFEALVEQVEVEHSTAQHARLGPGRSAVTGPLARLSLNSAHLTPLAREAAARLGLRLPETDPYRSLAARIVETALCIDVVLDLMERYEPPRPPSVEVVPRAGRATWMTEAPRGTLYHRFDVGEGGIVQAARIVPPTCHNLPNMEEDVRRTVEVSLDLGDDELQRRCEMAIRNYDPCISCATHGLTLHMDRPGAA